MTGLALRSRDSRGLFVTQPALERFASKVRFDAATGCVLWTGGTTCGQLKSARYGSFWDGGRRWFAHRWAAKHIHGLEIDGLQVDHFCPGGPNTLCVEHLQAVTQMENLQLQWGRRLWGWDEWEEREPDEPQNDNAVPFFSAPEWLRPFVASAGEECPF